jgi:hypothetical protein
LVGDSTITSRLPPAFAATEYSLSFDLITRATEHRIVTTTQRTKLPRSPARLLYGPGSTRAVNVTVSE